MIGKITAIIGAGAISGLITSVGPGPAPDLAMQAALRGDVSAPYVETIVVDRSNKGDRLIVGQHPSGSSQNEAPAPKIVPLGCEPAFSPLVDPTVAYVFKRCMA